MKHSLWDALPNWLLTWLVSFALDQGLAALLRVESRWWLAALLLLLWCALLAVAERLGRFWAMLALWIAACGLVLLLSDRALLAEAALGLVSPAGRANVCGKWVLLLLCATAALPLSALLRSFWVRLGLSLGWTALWIAAALTEWPLPRQIPAALIPLLLLSMIETIRRLQGLPEQGAPLRRALLLSLLPASLLLGLLPAPAEPYGYPLLHELAESVGEAWHDVQTALRFRFKGDAEFGVAFDGFSEKAELGEGSEEGGTSVLFAAPWQAPDGPVYFFGNSWDRFDGRQWSSTLKQEDAASLNWGLDTAEHLYALWRMLDEEDRAAAFSDYFRANYVYVVGRKLNVRTMFNLMNATHLFTDARRFPYAEAPTGLLFDYVQREESWYRIYFLETNARTRGALLDAAEGTAYDAQLRRPYWSQVADDFGRCFYSDLPEDVSLERAFARREALIRDVYLDCAGVSDRARALAEEITASCSRDSEKAAAIAAYLQDNYRYTLSPDPVPKGENFLDWLLFESEEGYCTWYATAAVLLSRSVGVPARYVQGYLSALTGEGYTRLGPEAAHAWCECYIGGYGWVTVEATPGFKTEAVGWLTAAEKGETDSETAAEAEEAETGPDSGADESGETPSEPPLPDGRDETASSPEPVSEPKAGPARYGWLLLALFAALLAGLPLCWLWLRARKKRRYAEADPSARLLMDLELLLRDLRGRGYPRRPEESLRDYFARLPWHYLLVNEAEAKEMAALYDRCLFGGATPSEAELARHRAFAVRFRPRGLRQWMIWSGLQG